MWGEIFVSGGVQAPTEMRCGASFCHLGNAESVSEVTLTNGQPQYTEKRKIDGDFEVVQDNMFENEISFDGWNKTMLDIL